MDNEAIRGETRRLMGANAPEVRARTGRRRPRMKYKTEVFDQVRRLFDVNGFNDHQLHCVLRFDAEAAPDADVLREAVLASIEAYPPPRLTLCLRLAQFGSFLLPLVILVPVPLTLIGIVLGHWLLNAAGQTRARMSHQRRGRSREPASFPIFRRRVPIASGRSDQAVRAPRRDDGRDFGSAPKTPSARPPA